MRFRWKRANARHLKDKAKADTRFRAKKLQCAITINSMNPIYTLSNRKQPSVSTGAVRFSSATRAPHLIRKFVKLLAKVHRRDVKGKRCQKRSACGKEHGSIFRLGFKVFKGWGSTGQELCFFTSASAPGFANNHPEQPRLDFISTGFWKFAWGCQVGNLFCARTKKSILFRDTSAHASLPFHPYKS